MTSSYDTSADESELYFGVSYNPSSANTANSILTFNSSTGELKSRMNFENFEIQTITVSVDYQFMYIGGTVVD